MDFSLKNLCWDRNQINFISNISVQFVLWLVSSFKKLVWSTADFTNSIGEKKFLAGLLGVRSLENLYGVGRSTLNPKRLVKEQFNEK